MQRPNTPSLEHLTTLHLPHNGDCSLLAVSTDFVYVEEVYGEAGWLAQHGITFTGEIIASVDEIFGTKTDLIPLELPTDAAEPKRGWHTMALNFTGPRHRGLRGPERLDDLVRPFSIQEKMALTRQLELKMSPPMLLGLAESYVLAEALIRSPSLFVVCRRLRLAYVLPQEQVDDTGEPYDYDTLVIYAAHFYDTSDDNEAPLSDMLQFAGTRLSRPMDCAIYHDHLFVADGGEGERSSVVHIWRVSDTTPKLSDEEALDRKLYG